MPDLPETNNKYTYKMTFGDGDFVTSRGFDTLRYATKAARRFAVVNGGNFPVTIEYIHQGEVILTDKVVEEGSEAMPVQIISTLPNRP